MARLAKTNSVRGVNKNHGVVRGVASFLEELMENTPVDKFGAGRFKKYRFKPSERIEVRDMRAKEGSRHFIFARVYDKDVFQDVYLYCGNESFVDVMKFIVDYCERNPMN